MHSLLTESCQGRAAGIASTLHGLAAPVLRRHQCSAPGDDSTGAVCSRLITTPPCLVSSVPKPPANRCASTACYSYSRTSWRTAILSESAESVSSNTSGFTSSVGPGSSHRDAVDPPNDGVEGPDTGLGGTLTDAELSVKLSLAAGSGRLDLTDCRLQALPPEVLQLEELEELQLSGNCLTQLPDGISRLTVLRRLGLAGNLLSRLPPGIGALTALEGLWLHGNLLTHLPPQLGALGALRVLSLAGNCLQSVPAGALCGLTALTDLTLAGNRLAALPPGALAPLTRLRKLALNGNRLTSGAPGELGVGAGMTGLTELMLQGNRLESLDPAIFECPALQELSAADNNLTELPPRLAGASSLARLHLFGNRLVSVSARQLAALPALTTVWLEGNPLRGNVVAELVAAARSGALPRLRALGLDQAQMAAAAAAAATAGPEGALPGVLDGAREALPTNVRVGCVLGQGPGYFKLQYGPQRTGGGGGGGGCTDAGDGTSRGGPSGGGLGPSAVSSNNELLVVAFGSAPGTPNWGGLLSKVYGAATDEGSHFDVLFVADPSRDWYGGGDDATFAYYRDRLASYTRHYRRVLLLGDSMGATAALLFADLATGALAFCPQVDLTAASIRPGRTAAWLACLRERLVAAVRGSRGQLSVLVGTWQHDLAQANMLPVPSNKGPREERSVDGGRGSEIRGEAGDERLRVGAGDGGSGSARCRWRDPYNGEETVGLQPEGTSSLRASFGPAAHRKPWAWQQQVDCSVRHTDIWGKSTMGPSAEQVGSDGVGTARSSCGGDGGVNVKVFSIDSHRLAAALDARGQLVPLVRDAILNQLGLRSGSVRVANLL